MHKYPHTGVWMMVATVVAVQVATLLLLKTYRSIKHSHTMEQDLLSKN